MNLGLMLLKKSGRQGSLKFVVTMLAAALGMLILLFVFSITNAMTAGNHRVAWKNATLNMNNGSANQLSASELKAKNAVIYVQSDQTTQSFLDKSILIYEMYFTGGTVPKASPLATYPAANEYYVSPALNDLLNQYPNDVLRNRFAGKQVGIIPSESLSSPDDLTIISGIDGSKFDDPNSRESMNATRIADFTVSSYGQNYQQMTDYIIFSAMAIGAIGLIIPVVMLITTAMALGAREREARYAALRLIGATKKQIRNIAFVDSLAASLAGVLAGATLYLLIRPILFNARMDGRRFFPEDISVSPLMFGAIVAAIVAIVWLANKIAMRKVITSPLGVARKQKLAKAPRVWSIVPLLLCLTGFIYLGSLSKDTAYEQFGTAFSLYILGLFMLTMLSLLLAGGWLTKLYGKLISLVDKRASGMLVSRRISYEARKIFRGIGGIVIAFFAGAFFIATFATIANFADGSTSTVIKAIPDNSIFATDVEGNASLVTLQKTIDKNGSYQNEPVKIYMSGVNTSVISCPDAVRLFHKNCIGTSKYLEMPSLSTDDTVDMTKLTDVIPTVANGTTFVEHIYLPKPGQNVDLVNAEKVVTANASQGNTAGVTVVNSTLRAVAINGILGSFKDLLYAGIVLTVIVASLNLIVATVAGLFDRKGSFFTLRLSGAEMPFLKKIVTRESMLPLVFISLVSIALGFYAAYVFLRLASTKLRYAFVLPEPFFWVCVVAVFVLSYLGIRLILPMLGKLTDIESNRTE